VIWLNHKTTFSVFITDDSIGFFSADDHDLQRSYCGKVELNKGIVENGRLLEPETFTKIVASFFKEKKVKPKKLIFVLNEQNVLIRDLFITKDELDKKPLMTILEKHLGEKINTPFSEPVFSHVIRKQNSEGAWVLVFIADKNLLLDYLDVFEHIGIREVIFDLPTVSLYRLYKDETKASIDNTLMVSLYNGMISIQIIEDEMPIFGMIEDFDAATENVDEVIENYISRIANYYRYNLRKGDQSITRVWLYNFTDSILEDAIEKLLANLDQFDAKSVDLVKLSIVTSELSKICHVAFASSHFLKNQESEFKFDLERINRARLIGRYLLVVAISIFAFVSVLLIPYSLNQHDISSQRSINLNLEQQLELLEDAVPEVPRFTNQEINYSNAYDYLSETDNFPIDYINDLFGLLPDSLKIVSYKYTTATKEIVIDIEYISQIDADEYVILVYETHGVEQSGTPSATSWINGVPITRSTGNNIMEVKFIHA
jgi:type IV pilus assembly protein PilM